MRDKWRRIEDCCLELCLLVLRDGIDTDNDKLRPTQAEAKVVKSLCWCAAVAHDKSESTNFKDRLREIEDKLGEGK